MKNQSDRTFQKQVQFGKILKTTLLNTDTDAYTFHDLYGGEGLYNIKGMLCMGSAAMAHYVFTHDSDVQRGMPHPLSPLHYNGALFELNAVSFGKLQNNLAKECPGHNFRCYKLDNEKGVDLARIDSYIDGMLYFDPPGIQMDGLVKTYNKAFPRYSILCNLQRNSTIRHLGRLATNPVAEITKLDKQWLISIPERKLGWTWLLGVETKEKRDAVRDQILASNSDLVLYDLESEAGQYSLKLMTEVGHKIKKKKKKK